MGIPYSKEINHAFVELNKAYGQVTPLVAAAYEVLETSKNITLMMVAVQILNSFLLTAILMCMLGLLVTMNPDLDKERQELVTPAMVWITSWASMAKRIISTLVFLFAMFGVGVVMIMRREDKGPVAAVEAGEVAEEAKEGEEGGENGEGGDGGGSVEKAQQR